MTDQLTIGRSLVAELIGSMLLSIAVVGSGIMASNLTNDVSIQLLANAWATVAGLTALIMMFKWISGAHFNPVVTIAAYFLDGFPRRAVAPYIGAQLVGCCIGTVFANLMFNHSSIELSTKIRTGPNIWLAEVIATFGLLLVIFLISRSDAPSALPYGVGLWIGGAYWFTSSTSLANPAITIARSLTDSFAGIAPRSVPMFIVMQIIGLAIAIPTIKSML